MKGDVLDDRELYEREHRMNSKLISDNSLLRAVRQDDKATIARLHEALQLIAAGTVCPDLFPNENNGDALAAKTAMTIAIAALEVSTQVQRSGDGK